MHTGECGRRARYDAVLGSAFYRSSASWTRRYSLNEAFALPELDYSEPPAGSDRRTFMMRSAMAAAVVALGGRVNPLVGANARRCAARVDSRSIPNLQVVKNTKGPVMTLVDEFYKVGPGPSSSHTIGPMRITYDFYQRAIEAAGRPARAGDRAQGEPVRQPQRDRQRPRHRARRAGRPHRI